MSAEPNSTPPVAGTETVPVAPLAAASASEHAVSSDVSPPEESGAGTPDATSESQKTRIKIGTQRPGVAVPRIEPRAKVVFQTEPRIAGIPVEKSEESAVVVEGEGSKAQAEPEFQPPIKRKSDFRTQKFETLAPRSGRVEPPNLRAALPPELEAELQAALGNESIDQLIAAENSDTTAAALLEPESRHKAKVARIFRDDVFVDLPGHNQGVLALHSFVKEPAVGDILDVVVTRVNTEDGLYELSAPGASVDVGDWSDLAEGITVEARITGHNKGGLECEVNKIRGFIPAGQISIYRVENFEEFVGQSWSCVVVEANADRRNLVLSRRGFGTRTGRSKRAVACPVGSGANS